MNNIRPFRFWCQKVLPLVYDDSLSYYELLCKVVAKLNEVVDNENQLNEAFQQLKNWVENYFDSHDFQQMVNDKLDSMVEDGTLGSLINDKLLGDINAKIENNTNDISAMKPKVEQLENNVERNTSTINNHTQRITALEGWSLKGKQIDWFGDSLIRGETEGQAVVDKPIPKLFAEMTGANCINHAESGATISNNAWATKVINQVNSADLRNSDYVIVEGGINDYVLNYPIGDVNTEGSFIKGLVDIFNAIDAKNHNAKIIMCTLFPNSALFKGSLGHDGQNFLNFNNAIKQACRDRCIRCIDVTYNSINYNYFNTVCPTGTHFTQEGYNILTLAILNLITTAGTALPVSSGQNLIKGLFPTMDLSSTDEGNSSVVRHGNCIILRPGDKIYTVVSMSLTSMFPYTLSFIMRVKSGKANLEFGTESKYSAIGKLNGVPGTDLSRFVRYEITINPTFFNERMCFTLTEDSTCEYAIVSQINLVPGEVPCYGDEALNNQATVALKGFNSQYPLLFKQRDRLVIFNGPVQVGSAQISANAEVADLSNYNFAKGLYCPASAVIYASGLDGAVYPLLLDFTTYKLKSLKAIPANTNLGITSVIDIS